MDDITTSTANDGHTRSDRWILSLDGGGMRGLATAVFLGRLEEEIGLPLSRCFDLVAGTSSGAIVAGSLAIGPDDKQIVATSQLPDIFAKDGPRIFRSTSMGTWKTLRWLRRPLYETSVLADAIEKGVGTLMLSDLRSDLLVTSYDMRGGRPVLFQSWLAGNSPDCVANRAHEMGIMEMCPTREGSLTPNFKLRDALVASAVVPTFFAPLRVPRTGGDHYALIDGFVYALNPVLPAYFAARRRFGYGERFHILSIGTGRHERVYDWAELANRGAIGWVRPVLETFPIGVSEASETYMDWITEIAQVEHVRINPVFDQAIDPDAPNPAFDDASPDNIRRLIAAGHAMFDNNVEVLRRTVDLLKAHSAAVTAPAV